MLQIMKRENLQEDLTKRRIGDRIKAARKSGGLSLNALASRTGVGASTICKIENYTMVPSVTTLVRIAAGLGREIDFFINEGRSRRPYEVMRSSQSMLSSLKGQKILLRSASSKFKHTRLEVHHNTIYDGGNSGRGFASHLSEEVAFCMKGNIVFEIEGDKVTLNPMDSIHIESGCRHRWMNSGEETAEVIFIFSPPLFHYNRGYSAYDRI
jgi:transcriptional regulator with XRE-family HTH domain